MCYYVTRQGLKLRRSRGQGGFACNNCDRRYHQLKNLKRHVINECGKQPMHQCTVCPYRATYRSYLQVHMMKHTKQNTVVTRISRSSFLHRSTRRDSWKHGFLFGLLRNVVDCLVSPSTLPIRRIFTEKFYETILHSSHYFANPKKWMYSKAMCLEMYEKFMYFSLSYIIDLK